MKYLSRDELEKKIKVLEFENRKLKDLTIPTTNELLEMVQNIHKEILARNGIDT